MGLPRAYSRGPAVAGGGGGGGVTDHGALTGLADDDHTQYALVSGTRAFTGAQLFAAGAAATPSLAVGSATAGLFSGGSGATEFLGFAANGTEFMRSTSALATLTVPMLLPAGSAAAPSLAVGQADLGLYRVGAGALGFATVGVVRANLTATGLRIGDATAATSPLDAIKTGAGVQIGLALRNETAAAADVGTGIGWYGISQVQQAQMSAAWNGAASTDSYLSFHTRGGDTVAERMRITSNGNLLVGATAQPTYPGSRLSRLHVIGGNYQIVGASLDTDATSKTFFIACVARTITQVPVGVSLLLQSASTNELHLGGGNSTIQAATSTQIWAAAALNTPTGISMLYANTSGIRIQSGATTAASSLFHVAATGDANALRVSDTNGTVGIGTAPSSGSKLAVVSVSAGSYFERTASGRPTTLVVANLTTAAANTGSNFAFSGQSGIEMVQLQSSWDGAATTDAHLRVLTRGGDATAERMRLDSLGSLLLGTSFTNVPSSLLTLTSTTRGFLLPRMDTTAKNAISSPATALMVYDITLNKICVYTGAGWETVTSA